MLYVGANQSESNRSVRPRRLRFGLRTLLLLPLLTVALLLTAFPKLLTGDIAKVTVVAIEDHGGRVTIELLAQISAGTGWSATLSDGYFGSMGVSGTSVPGGKPLLPTWPRKETVIINLGSRNLSAAKYTDSVAMLTVRLGETYRLAPKRPLDIAGSNCRMNSSRGSRLGL